YRIFGSRPGAYGAGLQGLIESQNWTDDQDLAIAYINWSSYAYSSASGAEEQGNTKAEILPNSQSPLPTPNSSLPTPHSSHPTPNSQNITPNTPHPTPHSPHPTNE
ncbi:MAG: cobaltochelatase subunit CobN, partial [Nostoc sp.]